MYEFQLLCFAAGKNTLIQEYSKCAREGERVCVCRLTDRVDKKKQAKATRSIADCEQRIAFYINVCGLFHFKMDVLKSFCCWPWNWILIDSLVVANAILIVMEVQHFAGQHTHTHTRHFLFTFEWFIAMMTCLINP